MIDTCFQSRRLQKYCELRSVAIRIKMGNSFIFHYLWNVSAAVHHKLAFTFQSPPLPSAPHPCNHVSSYIIAFQLLTGVWPLPPNMPNLIHVFPKRQRDACLVKGRGKKHAKLQKEMPVFSSAVTMQMQHLFSARHTLYFMVTWTLGSLGTDWRREEKSEGG